MRKDKTILGLVLARGGSKGIPKKNIKELHSVPLMGYIIQEAKKSKYLNGIWVSSDDEVIRYVATNWLFVNAIERPKELSDGSKPIDAIQHFLAKNPCDIIVLLNACCPLTSVEDIDKAIEIALETDCDSVVSLVEDFSSHPTKLCNLDGDKVVGIGGEFKTGERQKQNPIYKRNTAIYIMKRGVVEQGVLFGPDTRGYVMPKERSWDINDVWDWEVAEFLTKPKRHEVPRN